MVVNLSLDVFNGEASATALLLTNLEDSGDMSAALVVKGSASREIGGSGVLSWISSGLDVLAIAVSPAGVDVPGGKAYLATLYFGVDGIGIDFPEEGTPFGSFKSPPLRFLDLLTGST